MPAGPVFPAGLAPVVPGGELPLFPDGVPPVVVEADGSDVIAAGRSGRGFDGALATNSAKPASDLFRYL